MYRKASQSGSALILALIFALVLTSAGATTYLVLRSKYRQAHQNACWQEALLAAEGGVDLAMNSLRLSLRDPDNAWSEWHQNVEEQLDGETTAPGELGTGPGTGSVFVTSAVLLRNTEGGSRSWSEV
ncbi:MAG: hypothetical protein M3463_08020, partial [Verrucomicrobiota bacterium]|nr:hypothetical protein [Verrucomicrobiota bacterium]